MMPPKRWLVALVMVVFLAACLQVPVWARGRRSSSLWSRLRSLRRAKASIQQRLRQVKAKQTQTKNKLVQAQQELERARSRLRKARAELRATRAHIARVKKELAGTQARLEQHRKLVAARLLAAYRSAEPTALAMVLEVADYEDLANQMRFARAVAEQDQAMLTRLIQFQHKLAARKAELAELERRQARYHAQVQAETEAVAARERKVRAALQEVLSDRKKLEAQLAALLEESKRIESMLASLQRGRGGLRYTGKWSGKLLKPVPGRITSGFGMRMHPILHYRRMHTGVDISAGYGTPIKAADKGLVVYAGWRGGYGKCVIIDHGSGIATLYAHLSRISVSRGQIVKRGAIIGAVGSTGLSTGPHLHFEVRKYGRPVDPLAF